MRFRPDRLREVRENRKMLQRDLVALCGLNANQVSRYEQGTNEPSIEILARLAYHLGITADYLLDLTDEPHESEKFDLREDERELLAAYTVGDAAKIMEISVTRIAQLERLERRAGT